MLSATEFTVGILADATPLSLMLPRMKHEATILIGQTENGPAAVFIGGQYNFHFFECSDATNWKGLLIPNVRIEVDETTLFDPDYLSAYLGTVVRTDTRLDLSVKAEHAHGRHSKVILETELPSTRDLKAGFSKWRIVIGEGQKQAGPSRDRHRPEHNPVLIGLRVRNDS